MTREKQLEMALAIALKRLGGKLEISIDDLANLRPGRWEIRTLTFEAAKREVFELLDLDAPIDVPITVVDEQTGLLTGWKAPASITCPQCQRTSYHPGDVEARYCACCGYHDHLRLKQGTAD